VRILNLQVQNLRAVRFFAVENLPDAVVIAGPNGCGKSSVFDAIRLLKSAYGQYNQSEYEWWFNEFQINVRDLSREASRVLNNPSKDLLIRSEIELAAGERSFLLDNVDTIATQFSWRRIMGGDVNIDAPLVLAPQDKRSYGDQIATESTRLANTLKENLVRDEPLVAQLTMNPKGEVSIASAPALEMAFSLYQPATLGVIDYHAANRTYSRERVANINLAVAETEQRSRQNALYNTQNKYANIKTEMASAYIRELLAEKAGEDARGQGLIETLKELFEIFFPGKRFLGPRPTPDGSLRFPVELESGGEHDIDELSSGEKEVLLGYLRLRNSAPQNSVILLDEPELHLNPRLIRGLPRFYQKHVGEALHNQLWMVTHSDTLLREAVEEPAFAVYHMQSPTDPMNSNQAILVNATAEIDRTVIDLVGDLATYSPQAKLVLLEGGGDSEVDANIIQQLFPAFADQVNLVSSGSKQRVRELHSVLEQAALSGKLRTRVFSIVDRDSEEDASHSVEHRFVWDVYHVENYLLHSGYIRAVLESLALGGPLPTELEVEHSLKAAAERTIPTMVRIRLEQFVQEKIRRSMEVRIDPNTTSPAAHLVTAARRARERLNEVVAVDLEDTVLLAHESSVKTELRQAIEDETWKSRFRGRDILKRFANDVRIGIPFERFRNLIVNRMRQDGYQPPGMTTVINSILN
jgi:energy-coupling factor transporter ATP-binding protein EcfA2